MAGCGSSTNAAVSNCDSVVTNDFCPRAVDDCGYYSFSACVSDAEAQLGCGGVIDYSSTTLDTCDYDINTYSCGSLFYADGTVLVPSSCQSAFY
ncbi:MAG TPA: hypothetical protein VI456_14790 [Polyangia bacterium]